MAKASPSKSNWYQQMGKLQEHSTAKLPGSKEIPEGDPNCLEGVTIVITGQLESLGRDEAKNLVERYGGRVTTAVSSRTTYVLLGDDPGKSKLAGVEKNKTKTISEDDLLQMIGDSKKKSPASAQKKSAASSPASKKASSSTQMTPTKSSVPTAAPQKRKKVIDSDDDIEEVAVVRKADADAPNSSAQVQKKRVAVVNLDSSDEDLPLTTKHTVAQSKPSTSKPSANGTKISEASKSVSSTTSTPSVDAQSTLWVDKYAPRAVNQIIGMGTPASAASKLRQWLLNWQKSYRTGIKPNIFASRDGAGFRAALISGPPGLGKTTTAVLVCKELGLNYVHLNASDSRSKKLLDQQLAGALENLTILDYWSGSKPRQAQQERSKSAPQTHAVMIFDEVDGVAGNEDRGGIAELIQLIKQTKFPIICICNDRSHLKVRSLANYCFDMRVNRPQLPAILPILQRIREAEGVRDMPDDVLRQIIIASMHDIRQCINTMSLMAAADDAGLADSKQKHKEIKAGDVGVLKDSMKKSPFDACREVFHRVEDKYPGYAIKVKNDLFFQDYNFMPLFVQDNYLRTAVRDSSMAATMERFSNAADAISYGDVISSIVRGSQQAWSLLPLLSAYACVIPGEICNTNLAQQTQFPSWLGKNSTTNKNKRSLQDLLWHMKLRVSCSSTGLVCEYVPLLARKLLQPLQTAGSEGVAEVIDTLHQYDLIKEDMLSLVELNTFDSEVSGNSADKANAGKTPFDLLDPKVKAALTRGFNKEGKPLPYSLEGPVKKKRGGAAGGGGGIDEVLGEMLVAEDEAEAKEQEAAIADDEDEDEKDDLAKNPNIKSTAASTTGRGARGGAKSTAAGTSQRGRGAASSTRARGGGTSSSSTQRGRGAATTAASKSTRGGAAPRGRGKK